MEMFLILIGLNFVALVYAIIMRFIFIRRVFYLNQIKIQINDGLTMNHHIDKLNELENKHPFGVWWIPWYALQFNKILKDAIKEK